MRVIHIPYWGDENPYQKLILENLQKIGVEAKGESNKILFSVLYVLFTQGKNTTIHLHWLDHFIYFKNNLFLSLFKSITFLFELLILKALKVKLVWTVHNLKGHESKYQRLETFLLTIVSHLSDQIIVHCKKAKSEVEGLFKVKKKDKIAVIKHGNYINCYKNILDPNEAKKHLNISSAELTFLYLGQIRPYKGVLELIDTFQKLNTNNIKLIVAGKPRDNQMAELVTNKAGKNKNIRLILKYIPDDEIQVYMNAADVVIFPFKRVLTSGGVILAMSFGKPIIAPNIGCIPETLDTIGSFIYSSADKDGLLTAMKSAIISKHNLHKMGRYNLELAKKLSWKNIANSTLRVYENCLKE